MFFLVFVFVLAFVCFYLKKKIVQQPLCSRAVFLLIAQTAAIMIQ